MSKLINLASRLAPLKQKILGHLSLCPWSVIWEKLDPRTLGAYPPPMDIQVVELDGPFKKLRFAGKHEVWFPEPAPINAELWSEYLCVFWPHRTNGHYYLKPQTPVNPGDICIDCGACEGFFGLQALAAGAGKVICLEPSELMSACLRRTFESEIAAGKMVIVQAAAGVNEGSVNFCFDNQQPFAGKAQNGFETSPVRSCSLETVCRELQLPRVDFIKMDIEGAEIQAVEGAMPVLKQFHPRLAITTYHRHFDYAALRVLLLAAGYRRLRPSGLVHRGEARFRPVMIHAWN